MWMNRNEYARHRGTTWATVHKAIQTGRIEMVEGKIHAETADLSWQENTRPKVDREASQKLGGVNAQRVSENPEQPQAPSASEPPAEEDLDYHRDRARREKYAADDAAIDLAIKLGALARPDEIEKRVFAKVGFLRERLLQLPDRLSHEITPKAQDILAREIKDILDACAIA